jgi:hypothetical protein
MNELLFIPVNVPEQLRQMIARKFDSIRTARNVVAFAAALAVNLGVLGTLQWSATSAAYTPRGEVVITQLDSEPEVRMASN